MKQKSLLKTMLLLCALVVGSSAWATDKELTFDLSSNPGGWPTTNPTTLTNYTYTLNDVSYTFALNNVKCNQGYLMMTVTAMLGLPAIDGYRLTKVVASNSSSCSTSTRVGISSSSSTASYISGGAYQTWSTTGSSYTYNLTSTEVNTMYYLYVTNKNAQITQLVLTYEEVGSAVATTTTIDASGITYTDLKNGTAPGSLSATVKDALNNIIISGATVTWSGDNDAVATINTSTGEVTLVGEGIVNFTASYGGVKDEYAPSTSEKYKMTVTDTRYVVSDLTFTKAYGSGPAIADDDTEWTVSSDGSESSFDVTKGIHYGTGSASVKYITLSTSGINGTISKVVVNASTANGVSGTTVGVTVGGSSFGGDTQSISSTATDYTFNATSSAKGQIIVTVTKPSSATGALYVKSIKVHYEPSTDPLINATDPETLVYNAAEGEFGYSIINPTSATLSATSNSDWITNVAVDATNSKVTFSTSTNPNTTQRTGTITLSYTGATDKVVTVIQAAAPLPEISADNVNIAYDVTGGSIAYTISNPAGGALTATVTQGNWITLGNDFTSPIAFNCDANTAAAERTATVTLTYTYNTNETVSKEVTVTQAGNPDAFDPISSISEPNTEHIVRGTVVAINARGFVIGDGTGYVYTYLNATPSQSVGDKVSITGTTGTYGHILQFTSSATIAEATTSNYDNTPAITAVDATSIAAFNSDYQLSDYVQLEGSLAKNSSNYEITVGSATARISYPTTAQTTALDALVDKDKDVRVKGYFAGFSSSTFTVMMESVEEIFIPKLSIDPTTVDSFEYEENEDLSDEQIITVTGTNLTGEITVSVTGEYELISETENGVSNLTLTSGDYFAVNLKDNLTAGDYNGVLTIASEGATSIVINLTGTVTPYVAPAIEATQTTVNVGAAGGDGTISITYTKIDTDLVDVEFYESNGTTPATYDWIEAEIDSENNNLYYTFGANTGEARTAYLKVYGVDNKGGDSYIYSELIAITQAKYEFPGSWVAANLADINANDVFVIVGDNAYALPNDGGTNAPSVASVNVADNILSGDIDDNLKWNVRGNATDGYTFYPNGKTDTWLYCSTTASSSSNNNIKVGTGERKLFELYNNHLVTMDDYTERYLSIYVNNGTPQDWRGYTNTGSAADITFYKKLAAKLNAYGYATFSATVPVDFSLADGFSAWAITAISGTSITFSQITGAVPANTGVLLKGATGETVYPAATASGTAPSSNLLEAITTATSIEEGKYYGLSGESFMKINAGTIPAGKALLPTSVVDGAGARLTFVFEDAQGIKAIEHPTMTIENAVYNLNGQRVDSPKKGLYIVNGKKVVMK